jgi:hypothetical protein
MNDPLVEDLVTAGERLAQALADPHSCSPLDRGLLLEDWQRAVTRVATQNVNARHSEAISDEHRKAADAN